MQIIVTDFYCDHKYRYQTLKPQNINWVLEMYFDLYYGPGSHQRVPRGVFIFNNKTGFDFLYYPENVLRGIRRKFLMSALVTLHIKIKVMLHIKIKKLGPSLR